MNRSSHGIMLLLELFLAKFENPNLNSLFISRFSTLKSKSRHACNLAEEWALNHLMSSPRLLTSWCWREKGVPAFSPSAPSSSGANGLHQELLLGFDVSPGCEHSVLSMTVERKQAADGSASTWSIDLQVSWLSATE